MKTKPMTHQAEGERRLLAAPKYHLLGCEQGTGKTWVVMNDAERQFAADQIDALLVLAPKGVHTNWVRREIPAHMSVPVRADYWSSGLGKRRLAELERLLRPIDKADRELRVLTMNIDAVNTKTGFEFARKFLRAHRCMMAVDESSRIKNINSERTKRTIELGELAVSRRAMSGTPITQAPTDIFAQFEFLAPGAGLLGTRSYRAFVAEYAVLVPPNGRLVLDAVARSRPRLVEDYRAAVAAGDDARAALLLPQISRVAPQITARDQEGRPRYKNIDKLQRLIEPHMYRVTKADCLDLPEKIYQTREFELEPAQRRLYDRLRDDLLLELEDGRVDRFTAMTKLTKLQQITSGFVMVDGEPRLIPSEENPRIELLQNCIEDCDCQFIVWARYREELAQIEAALRAMNIAVCSYHGGIGQKERELAVDGFQHGDFRAFVGQQQSGGIGITLTAAEQAFYHSNTFSLEDRLQSEDRCHRIGTRRNVIYTDLCAMRTVDERIAASLQAKEDVATRLLAPRTEALPF